ncbi:hypothetical protein AB4Y96_13215 [Phyllobacterium sp. TAF24]|uniref:hypothetical protein n=1 Tax=Phyllobacterium sp. TAF24 TaxID=3233068 RepID=UPI003F9C484C
MNGYGWRGLVPFAVLLIASCTGNSNSVAMIEKNFAASNNSSVDLSVAVPSQWEKVCVAGPYSTEESVRQMLGFGWSIASRSAITANEEATLLMFVVKNRMAAYVDYPRKSGDFSELTGKCFDRADARFKVTRRGDGGLLVEH